MTQTITYNYQTYTTNIMGIIMKFIDFKNDQEENFFRRDRRFRNKRKKSNCVAYNQEICAELNCYNQCPRLLKFIEDAKKEFFKVGKVTKLEKLDLNYNSMFAGSNCAVEFLAG